MESGENPKLLRAWLEEPVLLNGFVVCRGGLHNRYCTRMENLPGRGKALCWKRSTHPVNMRSDRNAKRYAGTPLSPDDAARLVANVCEIVQQKLPAVSCGVMVLTRIFDMGAEVYEDATCSEIFEKAIEVFLLQKQDLRPASYREYKSVLGRLLRKSPQMGKRPVRSFRPKDCLDMLTQAFASVPTLDKGRRLLHCFFAYAVQQNWCRDNPVSRLRVMRRKELTVAALNMDEISRLLRTVAQPEHRACAAAVGLMLWGGMRPTEVTRLCWAQVDMEDMVVRVLPRVSKTGGARLITIQPVLKCWLLRFRPREAGGLRVAPNNWTRRWHRLRVAAGLIPWQADALRHTFASYHLRQFGDIQRLQLEMGHSSARLLFSRYLNLSHITRKSAAAFWKISFPRHSCGKQGKRLTFNL